MSSSLPTTRWTTAWIGLGSNLGDRVANLGAAVRRLRASKGLVVRRVSPVWKSAPAEFRRQPWFFNAAVRVRAEVSPMALLRLLKRTERTLGRRPGRRFGPRAIDLDLLLYGDRCLSTPRLIIPHPGLARRSFALAPIVALAPRARHPALGLSLARLLRLAPGRARRLSASEQHRWQRLARSARDE